MSKLLTIGSTTYEIPNQGDNPEWGENVTAWICGANAALASVQGANDILLTSATLSNNQTSAANIPGLLFNTAQVEAVEIDYFITRTFDSGTSTTVERGKILGVYDGSDFFISTQAVGDAGVSISVLSSGQFQYTSTDLTNHTSSTIRFEAKTTDTP